MSRIQNSSTEPRRISLKLLSVILLVVSVLAFSGCRGRSTLPPHVMELIEKGGEKTLRMGVHGFHSIQFDPGLHLQEYSRLITSLIHAGPIKRLPDGQFAPDLFSNYWVTIDPLGNMAVEGQWRTDLKWHDGTAFSPDSLNASIEFIRNEESSPYREIAAKVLSVQSFDRGRRTRVTFEGNSRQYLELLAMGILRYGAPEEVSKTASSTAETIESQKDSANASATFPVGLGPFRVVESEQWEYILLERVSHASGGENHDAAAGFSKIVFRMYGDLEKLISDFRLGRLDWIHIPSEITTQLEELKIPDSTVIRYKNPCFVFWGYNCLKPPFSIPEFRRALFLMIDRNSLKQQFAYEGRVLAHAPLDDSGTVSVQEPASREEIEALLSASGLGSKNDRGDRLFNGSVASFSILTTSDSVTRKLVAEAIAAAVGRFGIKVRVETVAWANFFDQYIKPRSFDSFIATFQAPRIGNWTNLFHESPPIGQSLNFTGIVDAEIQDAVISLDRFPEPTNPEHFRTVIRENLDKLQPGQFLFQPYDVVFISNSLQGVGQDGDLWDQPIAEWFKSSARP